MSFKKTVAIAAAAGALAAISVPAMAFENEFHGIYNLKYFVSNVENGGTTTIAPNTTLNKDNKANNYFEQRARLMYIAKASDDLKLVTHFELDTKFGGDRTGKYSTSSDGGILDADGISLETKQVYLDFNLGKSINVKTGIQPIKDSVKGIFIDQDATGILVKSKAGDATISTGYFRLATETNTYAAAAAPVAGAIPLNAYTGNTSQIGHANTDLFILDSTYAINKDMKVGLGYYLLADYSNLNKTVHMVDLNAEAKIGSATLSGFVAAETGYQRTATASRSVSGYAANVAAKAPVGPGTLKTAFLFYTGDGSDNNHNTQWQNAGGVTYAEGGMFLLVRTGVGGTTTDRTITGTTGTGTNGLWLYTLGYDAAITPKFYTNANVGMAWAAKNLGAPKDNGRTNATNYIGTEINLETGYKLYDNLTAKLQAGYVILGGFYKNSTAGNADPENPYTVRTALSYAF